MQTIYYIGLDVHKRMISFCVKDGSGAIHADGRSLPLVFDLDQWMKTLPQPWTAAMEAAVFTGWIYDHLQPHAAALKVAHPLMLRAIVAAKKKNDRIDASKICDCLRCDFLPECYMASTAIRERRRTLRYRNLLVRQMMQMKNKISGLLMEAGVNYNKQRLHKAGYFRELLATNPDIDEGCVRCCDCEANYGAGHELIWVSTVDCQESNFLDSDFASSTKGSQFHSVLIIRPMPLIPPVLLFFVTSTSAFTSKTLDSRARIQTVCQTLAAKWD